MPDLKAARELLNSEMAEPARDQLLEYVDYTCKIIHQKARSNSDVRNRGASARM